MSVTKMISIVAVCISLTACAGPAPKEASTTQSLQSSIKVAAVEVDVSAVGAQTKGRKFPVASAKTIIEKVATEDLVGKGSGSSRVIVRLEITSILIIDAAQSILFGGESIMKGTVSLVDARDGSVLMAPVEISSGGGGWVMGGIIAASSLEDPATEIRQMSTEFSNRADMVIFGS